MRTLPLANPFTFLNLVGLLGLLAILPTTARAGARVPETYQDVPRSLKVNLDDSATEPQTLVLRLPACFSCGYSWDVIAPASIRVDSRTESPAPGMVEIRRPASAEPAIGGSEIQVMEFPRLAPGHYDVQLAYRRPFGKFTPIRTVALAIDVR